MIKNILFDFDGVILDSVPIRDYGFREVFKEFDNKLVKKLIKFHELNGGLSRYVKIRYFYNEVLGKEVSELEVQRYASSFSSIMRKELIQKKYLIKKTLKFISDNYKNYNLHIVSGSDEKELKFLCGELEITRYFCSINGSPIHKNELVKRVMVNNGYLPNETILIGDSVNDYEAAKYQRIDFYGFNNAKLKKYSSHYLDNYELLLK